MGKNRISTAELKLNGNYRKDRHAQREETESKFRELTVFKKGDRLEQPENITDDYVREYYKHHTAFLINLQILQAVDLPELEMMYSLLQQERAVKKRLLEVDIKDNLEEWEKLSKLSMRLSHSFSELQKKYYVSPRERTHLLLDNLQLEKAQSEQSIIKKLAQKKKK